MKLKIPPPIQTLIAMFVMYCLNKYFLINPVDLVMLLPVIILCCLSACYFLFSAVIGFKKSKTTVNPLKPETATTLVVSGPYRYSRNPMYAGMALLLLAWLFYLGNPLNLVVFYLYVLYITTYQIKPEEVALRKIFGEEFEAYCKDVRRWL